MLKAFNDTVRSTNDANQVKQNQIIFFYAKDTKTEQYPD